MTMKLITLITVACASVGSLKANTLPSEKRKNGPLVQATLSPVQVSLQESSAVLYDNETSTPFIYGTVIREDGLILTKASEVDEVESFIIRVGAKKFRNPKILARNDHWDLMLIKIEAEGLLPVVIPEEKELAHGTWIVCNGGTERRFRRARAGVISANKRELPAETPTVLGVTLKGGEDEGKLIVGEVNEESGAGKAGMKSGDVILALGGSPLKDFDALIEVINDKSPGDFIELKVMRDDEELDLKVELIARHKIYGGTKSRNDQLSGGETQQSPRRSGFPKILQHETMMSRRTMGGPIFTLDGEFVGMNIAAVNRVEAFAIPAKEFGELVTKMSEGR